MRKSKSKSVTRAAILRRIRIFELAQKIVNDMLYDEIRNEDDKYRVNLYMKGMRKAISAFRNLA